MQTWASTPIILKNTVGQINTKITQITAKSGTHIVLRWLKFPMLAESVPDKPILVISLQKFLFSSGLSVLIIFGINGTLFKCKETYRDTTKPSAEQPTIFQVQGSTEFISQPSITCNSSRILVFTAIKAATAQHKINITRL